ncbi:hypothetical protein [Litorilituus sediminis]|nr:hypothetical protein [Litorilituus sediminis]
MYTIYTFNQRASEMTLNLTQANHIIAKAISAAEKANIQVISIKLTI